MPMRAQIRWQVEMYKTGKEETAFSTGKGLYQFTVIPFGWCHTPATIERLMERVLGGMPQQMPGVPG